MTQRHISPIKDPTVPCTHLLSILLKEPELEALLQLGLACLPQLSEVLAGGTQGVQQLGDVGCCPLQVLAAGDHRTGQVAWQQVNNHMLAFMSSSTLTMFVVNTYHF